MGFWKDNIYKKNPQEPWTQESNHASYQGGYQGFAICITKNGGHIEDIM